MSKRLFIAVDVIPDEGLISFYRKLKKLLEGLSIRWVDEKLFHLTLKFIGDTEESRIGLIKSALSEVTGYVAPFTFGIGGPGFFGSKKNPRVIFSEITQAGGLTDLSFRIDEKLATKGFEKEQRRFNAHLTLGRIKYLSDNTLLFSVVQQYRDTFFQTVNTQEVILYESILRSDGAEYIPLEKFLLKGN